MPAPAIIQDLVNRFRDSRELYRSGRYNETQLRLEFLNPFFEALGWDMHNRSNFAPQYREVIHEDSLEIEGGTKAPDYAFRIGTTRKFFVEAKKPAVDIRYAIHPAYQLRRYAWNAHLPLSILTDFEELAVYDCRTRPDPKDSAATGRVMLFSYEDYLSRWDELAAIFSKDAVWNGSFDRFAEGSKGKRGTTEVDDEFLKEIEAWRDLLSRNIALRNFRASARPTDEPLNLPRAERQLNYAVQTTIDRLLFLRICEDRLIEPQDQLLELSKQPDLYANLLKLFEKADQKYNSGLFHFHNEKGQTSPPDTFTPTLKIDDKVLREIIRSLYYPCPYIFKEIPVEILGQVYEQFLGKVIRLTPGGQAKVEEKPEVRKAGGVYYTPSYIVDYIVQNTLGPLLNPGATPSSQPTTSDPALPQEHAVTQTPSSETVGLPARQTPSSEGDEGGGVLSIPAQSRSVTEGETVRGQETTHEHTYRHRELLPVPAVKRMGMRSDLSSVQPSSAEEGGTRSVTEGETVRGQETTHEHDNEPTDPSSQLISSNPSSRAQLQDNTQTPSSEAVGLLACRVLSSVGGQGGGSLTLVENPITPLTPEQALKLRVIDPACGSGSFLLGAYQYLLDWHLNYYLTHDPESHTRGKNPPIVATDGGEYRLTTQEKKRILTANIYGVDIDAQAVEVTKLSLLLKLLEGETGQLTLGFERVLPDLGNNIRSGNSLIGWDYFKGQIFPDEEEIIRVNPFDWQSSFPEVFAQGGFDAVIGNPPYIRIQSIREWAPKDVDHYKLIYKSALRGNFDIYVIFIERSLQLLKTEGRLGFILPHKFFQADFASPIREIITQGQHLQKIVHFGAEQVFKNATTYTCLLFLNRSPQESFDYTSVKSLEAIESVFKAMDSGQAHPDYESAVLPAPEMGGKEWEFFANDVGLVLQKLRQQPKTLADVTKKIFVGLQTSADNIYVLKKVEERENTYLLFSKSLNREVEIEKGMLKPFLMGKDVHRYEPLPNETFILFPYIVSETDYKLLEPAEIRAKYPLAWAYIMENKAELSEREKGRYQGKYFYAFSRPQSMTEYQKPKIITPDIALGPQFTFDSEGKYTTTTIYSFVFNDDQKESPLYFLGILNSPVMWFFLSNTGNILRGGYFRFKTNYLNPFPVPIIDFSIQSQVLKHDEIVNHVKRLLEVKQKNALTHSEKIIQNKLINELEERINTLVYSLFGLTELEVKTVSSG